MRLEEFEEFVGRKDEKWKLHNGTVCGTRRQKFIACQWITGKSWAKCMTISVPVRSIKY